ncbi:hypothetical protein PCANC_24836 [Puccinia coronata f. sp. avenae]|uniref:Uncharacterized protein n=1 Tax=Puccinia coronata f. sp. avenae TaxID=200324 RepID=A0A2N5S4X3_9BASI|nr:hypothetical protein PCANC_24836 [Puccinia coronata f. sp. avenae]
MVSEALLDPLELSGRIPDFQKAVPHPDPIRGTFDLFQSLQEWLSPIQELFC